MNSSRRRLLGAALFVAVTVVAAGCGDDDDDGATSGGSTTTTPARAAQLVAHKVNVVAKFDPAARQQAEGVTVGRNGDVYVSWSGLGQIVRVPAGGNKVEPFATIALSKDDFGVLGLATDADGNIYGAVQSKTANGLWKFEAGSGKATRIPGSEAIGFPNDVAVTSNGDVYVASSAEGKDAAGALQGGIWKVGADGTATKWLVNTELGGTGTSGLPMPIGANGIESHDGALYVTITEKGRVLVIGIKPDGSPGASRVLAEGPKLSAIDGLDVDGAGNVFAAIIGQSAIVRVAPDGTITDVAGDADGLDYPSSLEFGRGRSAGTLFVVNFAIAELLGGKTVEGPALLAIPPVE